MKTLLRLRLKKVQWIGRGLLFSFFYWTLESVRDTLAFDKDSFVNCFFFPDPMSFWIRFIVVCIIVLFGAYTQSVKDTIESKKPSHSPIWENIRIIKTGVYFCLGYWIIESLRDILLSDHPVWIQSLLLPKPMIFWTRILAIFVIFLFSLYVQSIIEERKKSEKKLQESENRLHQIFHQMPYPIQVFNPDGTIAMLNPSFLEFFGITDASMLLDGYHIFQDPLIRKIGLDDHLREAFGGRTVHIPELAFPMSHYKRNSEGFGETFCIFECLFFPVIKDTGETSKVVAIWKDVTLQKVAENEKEKMQQRLLQAQKMEAVGLLAGGIAHDFNNILTSIQGSAELAMQNLNENNPVLPDLKQIQTSAGKAADLTRQLLLFSRRHPMEFTSMSLNQLIRTLDPILKRLLGENIVFNSSLQKDLWPIKADRGTMDQVIMNLAINAKAAMRQGGNFTIKTENLILHDGELNLDISSLDDRYVRLSIMDTGIGMDAQTLDHIFEPFFTTKKPGTSTGLGLSVVYGIVQEHEGWIEVNSKPNEGTSFIITLPACSVEYQPEEKEDDTEIIRGDGQKLLVVEDDEDVRQITVRVLKQNGYQVFEATSAEDAVRIFDSEEGQFKLMFSDVVLPGKNGIELADELLQKNPNLRILLGSGYMDQKSQWPIIQQRGYSLISKPYPIMHLLRAVGSAIQNG